MFRKFPSKLLTSTGFTPLYDVKTVEQCARFCLYNRTDCKSFDYSNSSKSLFDFNLVIKNLFPTVKLAIDPLLVRYQDRRTNSDTWLF
jgi:hypothetical protein